MKKIIIIALFSCISVLIQHVIHELSHVFIGRTQGLKVEKIQWFTYHGGTKVFFSGEEKILNHESPITKQWIYMNIAGVVSTTLLAYVFMGLYYIVPVNYLKLFLWILSIFFLLTDSSYAMLCAFGNCGDLYMVNEYLGKKRYIAKLLVLLVFAVNCLLVYFLIKQ